MAKDKEQAAAEQAAAEQAAAEQAAAADLDPDLVALFKDGEKIMAHPTQVPLWLTQGWSTEE